MSIGIALGVTRDAILRVHHGVLEVLNDLVALVLGIEDGAVQVLCDLSGLLDGELVGGLGVPITLTGSHLVGQKLERRGKALVVQILLALNGHERTESPEKL